MKRSSAFYWILGLVFIVAEGKILQYFGESSLNSNIFIAAVFLIQAYLAPAYFFSKLAEAEYKASEETTNPPAWYAWIPGLHLWLLYKMSGKEDIGHFIALFIPVIGQFQWAILWGKLCERRGVNKYVAILMYPLFCMQSAVFLLAYLDGIPVSQNMQNMG